MKKRINNIIVYVILGLFAFTMLVPFVWMVLTAFKTTAETMQVDPFVLVPEVWQIENFGKVVAAMDFVRLYANTLAMIALRVVFAVATASLAGYAFARLKFKGKNFMFGLVLFQMMIPVQIFIIPQYLIVSRLHMMNTHFALLLPGAVTAFGTYLCKQSYQSLPASLEEAAELDGCNIGQRFLLIMLPLTRSSLVSLGIFTALFAYKDLMWPMIVCPRTEATTLTAALARLQGQFGNNFPQIMAGAVMAVVPMLIIYLIFQKQFVEGIATSGGKL